MNAHAVAVATTTLPKLPHQLDARSLDMTGQFLHENANKANLFFKADGDVDRSFTVVAALAYKPVNGDLDFSRNGLAIIDNDNWRLISDGTAAQGTGLSGASREQTALLEQIRAMDWAEFAAFCTAQAGYRAGSPDLDARAVIPACGDHENQVKLGLREVRLEDYRNDFIRALHDMGEYNLPLTSRDGMIRDLMVRNSVEIDGGRMLSWSISMDFRWDRSGHNVDQGEDLNPAYDDQWKQALAEDDTIMHRAVDAAMKPFMAKGFSVFEMGEEASIDLVTGGEDQDSLLLSTYRGVDMRFRDFRDLRSKLNALEGDELVNLWTSARVLDRDLNRSSRIFFVSSQLNTMRAEKEAEWALELDEEVSFTL